MFEWDIVLYECATTFHRKIGSSINKFQHRQKQRSSIPREETSMDGLCGVMCVWGAFIRNVIVTQVSMLTCINTFHALPFSLSSMPSFHQASYYKWLQISIDTGRTGGIFQYNHASGKFCSSTPFILLVFLLVLIY